MTMGGKFGVLKSCPMQVGWGHAAREFTPWLAQNIDKLGSAIGIPLEVVELPNARASVDILARNKANGSTVLIENQITVSNYSHLGLILTNLESSGAQTAVWIAADFSEEVLSALRWLNNKTAAAPCAFFAVRPRLLQIANSPYAPLFDVLERPSR
jgi:hypothetical protein